MIVNQEKARQFIIDKGIEVNKDYGSIGQFIRVTTKDGIYTFTSVDSVIEGTINGKEQGINKTLETKDIIEMTVNKMLNTGYDVNAVGDVLTGYFKSKGVNH
ncbi:hypothetical protein P9X10_01405 [Bacillus cereus]|nr:hypothetical protein [Bacillus cereus]